MSHNHFHNLVISNVQYCKMYVWITYSGFFPIFWHCQPASLAMWLTVKPSSDMANINKQQHVMTLVLTMKSPCTTAPEITLHSYVTSQRMQTDSTEFSTEQQPRLLGTSIANRLALSRVVYSPGNMHLKRLKKGTAKMEYPSCNSQPILYNR